MTHELVIDNFAGGGGASEGIEQAIGRPIDIAINHDPEAIATHKANHPHTEHLCQSVWAVNPIDVVKGRPVGLVWFSPDCKHFSKAKGGKPVQKNIRDLAWVVVMWAKTTRPRLMIIENVEEFITWGPLVDDKPCPIEKGKTFKKWVREIKKHGYTVEWRVLRACDYGAPTIRKRLFVICSRVGDNINWPTPTHGEGLLPYKTAAECIDWSNPAPSIFERKRPLAENTMRRIAKGLKRYVFDNPNPFIVKVNHKYDQFRGQSLDDPLQTITSKNPYGLVTPYLTECVNASSDRVMSAEESLRTVTAETKGGTHALVSATIAQHFGQSDCNDAQEPLRSTTQTVKAALVSAFMVKHYGGAVGCPVDTPSPTNTVRATQNQIVTSHMVKLRGDNIGHGTDEPIHTISAGGNHIGEVRAFLFQYYGTQNDQSVDQPLNTVTSRDRFGLVTIEGVEYQIVDIGMRMLQPRELYRAQGFPESYIIDTRFNGKPLTKTAQVKQCGNSVCPPVAKAIVSANIKARKMAA